MAHSVIPDATSLAKGGAEEIIQEADEGDATSRKRGYDAATSAASEALERDSQEARQELTDDNQRSPLLRLPPELRNRIYELVVVTSSTVPLRAKPKFPGLLAVNRQIRNEAGPLYFSLNTFDFGHAMVWDHAFSSVLEWLRVLDQQSIGHLRQVAVDYNVAENPLTVKKYSTWWEIFGTISDEMAHAGVQSPQDVLGWMHIASSGKESFISHAKHKERKALARASNEGV